MTEPVIPYGRQTIEAADIAAVSAVLRGDWLTQGPAVAEFEAALATAFASPHAVAVNSGTAALHAGMAAMGIGPGDLVLVPAMTFVASANAALYCGAEVEIVDVEPETALVDPAAVARALDAYRGPGRPRAVVAVHYAGLPCDMDALSALALDRGLAIIEDACHAPGATWTDAGGRRHVVGSGDRSAFSAFSFHPVKHVTTAEGGAVLTADPRLAARARRFRTHGITRDAAELERSAGERWWYEQHDLGFNYRLPDVLAALGTSQLARHTGWLARRREIAEHYRAGFAGVPGVRLQHLPAGREHAWHLFTIRVERRAAVFAALDAAGIRAQVHYIPVHWQPYYRRRYGPRSLPNAEAWYRDVISLPMFPALSDADLDRVIDAVTRAVVGEAVTAR